jgi:murein DD-endopeptidase MepM/ murein hydrolase activator NlpD
LIEIDGPGTIRASISTVVMKLSHRFAGVFCAMTLVIGTAQAGPQAVALAPDDGPGVDSAVPHQGGLTILRGAWRFLRAMSVADASWMLSELGRLDTLAHRPTAGDLSSPFGFRRDPIRRRRTKFHRGLDFSGRRGDPVMAAGHGTVVLAKYKGGYGRAVYIDHGNGVETRYAHLQRIHVRQGQTIEAGTLIGSIGSSGRSTGPHLHFEVRLDGRPVDPRQVMADVISPAGELLAALLNPEREAAAHQPRSVRMRNRF